MAMMLACGSSRAMIITNMNKTDIFSPHFPQKYPNNMNCSWLIQAKERERIMITLKGYELEEKYEMSSKSNRNVKKYRQNLINSYITFNYTLSVVTSFTYRMEMRKLNDKQVL